MSASARILGSLKASIGEVVFGMEDGTVSIFGLVFGVAISTDDPRTVLIAGASGAAAAAVSMMAGSYLDAESVRDARRARLNAPVDMAAETADLKAVANALTQGGMAPADVRQVTDVLARAPRAVTDLPEALAEADDGAGPLAHAFWMFVSDLFAGFTPVLPFALLPMHSARIVSLIVTTILLVALGVGRGLVAKRSVARATIETLVVAAAAAIAGIAMGRLLS
jgi:vacuolar iron transporter family protein